MIRCAVGDGTSLLDFVLRSFPAKHVSTATPCSRQIQVTYT
eukprot:COSAG01_NODE_42986_length_434_cov_1.205970_1_plen_40_part_10